MKNVEEALLESWDRQSKILSNVAEYVQPEWISDRVGPEEMSIGEHLCHIHGTRRYWLSQIDEGLISSFSSLYTKSGDEYIASTDLTNIRNRLQESSSAIRNAVADRLNQQESVGPYDHIVLFLQHMIWHEGWHVSSIMYALRAGGHEPTEEWEDPNVWGLWRNYG